jgi:excisionase family DNA binding protein
MLTVEDVASHFGLKPDTVRKRIKNEDLTAVRINRSYRIDWPDVWACESGPMPKGDRVERYKDPLMSKKDMAAALSLSVRSIDRMIARGLPTRSVFGAPRVNPHDATEWLRATMGLVLPDDWWR